MKLITYRKKNLTGLKYLELQNCNLHYFFFSIETVIRDASTFVPYASPVVPYASNFASQPERRQLEAGRNLAQNPYGYVSHSHWTDHLQWWWTAEQEHLSGVIAENGVPPLYYCHRKVTGIAPSTAFSPNRQVSPFSRVC